MVQLIKELHGVVNFMKHICFGAQFERTRIHRSGRKVLFTFVLTVLAG